MKTIFDCETEIGICEPDWAPDADPRNGSGSDPWKVFIHTKAALTHAKGMMKVEHRCLVRSGDEISDHPDVKPDMILEPAPDTEKETLVLAEQFHRTFIDRARQTIGNGCVA